MSRWNNIRTWNTTNFRVTLDWEYEQDPDVSWADEETLEKLNNGDYLNVCFRVAVWWDGNEIGTDYLGNSVYADPEDFAKEHIGIRERNRADGVNYGCYLSDMIPTAIGEARKHLASLKLPTVRAA